jgi:hypothetical protein
MAKVTILFVGHALEQGVRGENGGAPSKDSIWAVAYYGNQLITVSGRRNATVLKYKQFPRGALDEVTALFHQKLEGSDIKGIRYEDVTSKRRQKEVVGDLAERIESGFLEAKRAGKVDRRAMEH